MQAKDIFQGYDGDIYLYYGPIFRSGYQELSRLYEGQESGRKRACIVLVTNGGDPDAAYRMARATIHHYKNKIDILIPDRCKSAGTLMCIGANRLIFGDRGELGPLDVQLSNPDEMFDSMSGLDLLQAVNALQTQMLEAFRAYLVDIRAGSHISTKMASEIAQKLSSGLISPMAEKIDPVTLGQHQRAMNISYEYGTRLNNLSKALQPDALIQLVSSYPSHGFVIDRKEAAKLFTSVETPDATTQPIYEWGRRLLSNMEFPDAPCVLDVRKLIEATLQENEDELQESAQTKATDGSHDNTKQAEEVSDSAEKEARDGGKSHDAEPNKLRGV